MARREVVNTFFTQALKSGLITKNVGNRNNNNFCIIFGSPLFMLFSTSTPLSQIVLRLEPEDPNILSPYSRTPMFGRCIYSIL